MVGAITPPVTTEWVKIRVDFASLGAQREFDAAVRSRPAYDRRRHGNLGRGLIMEDRVGNYARICSALSLSLGILGGAACSLAAEFDCPPRNCSPVVNENGEKDCPNIHNMMVVGKDTVFLSHLPMFEQLNKRGDVYLTPHRFQVILEATFAKNGSNVDETLHEGSRGESLGEDVHAKPRMFQC